MANNMDDDEGSGIDLLTARGRDWPSVRQYNVFVPNRVGGLLDVVRRFEQSDNRIVSITVVDTADCAIIRLVLADAERALETLQQAKFAFTESDLLVVQLPDSTQPLLDICKALLQTENNIHYAYPLWVGGPNAGSHVALHVEDPETAAASLSRAGFVLLSENDLRDPGIG